MKFLSFSYTINLLAALFILLFVYTATDKLWSHHQFQKTLERSPLLSSVSTWLSWMIPVIELFIAVMLLLPRLRQAGFFASCGLMVLFTSYIFFMLLSGDKLPCSCGGIISRLSWLQHLWLNVILTLLAAASIYLSKHSNFYSNKQG